MKGRVAQVVALGAFMAIGAAFGAVARHVEGQSAVGGSEHPRDVPYPSSRVRPPHGASVGPFTILEFGTDGRPVNVPDDLSIKLYRGPCQIECETYLITVDAMGKVFFERTEGGYVLGTGSLDPDRVKDLVLAFVNADFFSKWGDPQCSERSFDDGGGLGVSLRFGSVTKTRWDDDACLGAEDVKRLYALASEVDTLAETRRWLP